MNINWILATVVSLSVCGCSAPQEVTPVPTVIPTVVPTATAIPTPTPTLTPRQQRKARAEERAEQRQIARFKREEEEAGEQRVAQFKREQEEARQQRAAPEKERVDAEQEANSLISDLDFKYVEDASEIRAMTERARKLLSDQGTDESNYLIMDAMNQIMPSRLLDDEGNNHQSYAEYVALYILNRKQGSSRIEVIRGMREFING